MIKVRHTDGIVTMYAHLAKALVRPGDRVAEGQLIAKAGCTGSCTGVHLHFQVWVNGKLTDPQRYLGNRVRLWRLAVVVHDLDGVSVGIEHVGAVVAGVVDPPLAGRPVVAVSRLGQSGVEGVHGRVVVGGEGEMHVLRRLAGKDRERSRPCRRTWPARAESKRSSKRPNGATSS